jgi:hypothetical protein
VVLAAAGAVVDLAAAVSAAGNLDTKL